MFQGEVLGDALFASLARRRRGLQWHDLLASFETTTKSAGVTPAAQ